MHPNRENENNYEKEYEGERDACEHSDQLAVVEEALAAAFAAEARFLVAAEG
jgi:hypothetical protein